MEWESWLKNNLKSFENLLQFYVLLFLVREAIKSVSVSLAPVLSKFQSVKFMALLSLLG